jgi:5'-nucleotidase
MSSTPNDVFKHLSAILFLLALIAVLTLSGCRLSSETKPGLSSTSSADFELVLLHTNDVHAHIQTFDRHGSTCEEGKSAKHECWGGMARMATLVRALRGQYPNSLLVDAGDQFQGTLFYTYYGGDAIRQIMNRIGYNAMALGNHEFDNGPENLARFISGLHCPVLSANLDASRDSHLNGKTRPWSIIEINGRKIGLIGYTTESTSVISSPGETISFQDGEKSIRQAVGELQMQGITHIVLLSHAGIQIDRQLATRIEGLDVIIGGHSHSLFHNTDPKADAPYPLVLRTPDDKTVLLVSAGSYGRQLGVLKARFNESGDIVGYSGEPILLNASIKDDPDIASLVAELRSPFDELKHQIVGSSSIDLLNDEGSCRFGECAIGNLICDAILWSTASDGVQVAFYNGGGIRASIAAGDISVAQINEVLPFGNLIATATLTGQDLLRVLEHSVSRADDLDNDGTGRFLQVSGMRYYWDPMRPVGQRIANAEMRQPDNSYKPLNLDAHYKIATSDFTRKGGDDYNVLKNNAMEPYDYGHAVTSVLIQYLNRFSPVAPRQDGRILKTSR